MSKLIENLANLIKVKTFVTLAVITVFTVLALNGAISPDNVMIIISMVVSFYFGTQQEKNTTPAVPTSQLLTNQIDTIADTVAPVEGTIMDAATYNATHPDSTAE